ncbi:Cell death protease [Tulasnella sp. 419]|nr:Cell death protease [Tulasnella sp. 419]
MRVILVLFLAAYLACAAPLLGNPSAASFYVPTLPGLEQDPNHPVHIYAGHLPSDPDHRIATPSKNVTAHLYFVLLKARRTADKERLVIWLNGGPGCSSFDGLMMETGPWRVDGKGGLKLIDGGWDEYAHVLYLDQPAGTGFSYASTDSYLHELDQVSAHVNQFLLNFYDVFPELATLDTYIAGESFAGQYIPYIADGILRTSLLNTQLKGVAIGNGWIDGRYQYPAYYEFALKNDILKDNSKTATTARNILDSCYKALNKTTDFIPVNVNECEGLMGSITDGLHQTVNGKTMCLNVYDIRLSDEWPACGMNWPPDLSAVTQYLRRRDVIHALHADQKAEAWTECDGNVFAQFNVRKSPSSVTLLPALLEKIDVLLFAGDQDYICNHLGIEHIIENLEWRGEKGLGVSGASHMVGFDVPIVAHDLILRFMNVDFTADALAGEAARLPSSVGDDVRKGIDAPAATVSSAPVPVSTGTLEKDKAKWEAYYNTGSAALILLLILLAIGLFFYIRSRRRSKSSRANFSALSQDDGLPEESIPLSTNMHDSVRSRKGKEKAEYSDDGRESPSGEPIFDVGASESESEEEEEEDDDDDDDERRGGYRSKER